MRVRRDRIDRHGRLTLRHRAKLHHIGMGTPLRGKRVVKLIHDLDVRMISEGHRASSTQPSWPERGIGAEKLRRVDVRHR